jgi:hypothetical protein
MLKIVNTKESRDKNQESRFPDSQTKKILIQKKENGKLTSIKTTFRNYRK